MSDLRFNTIAGTALASLLVVMGLRVTGETVFHPHFPEQPGYAVDISSQIASSDGGGAAAEEQGPMDWGVLLAAADAVAGGEKIAKGKCASCHSFNAGGANGTGPNLYGVVGRTAGAHPGFGYSPAMKAHAKPWTYDELNAYLTAPARHVPATIMAFVGLKKPEDRAQAIAYLRSLSDSPAPIPAPLPPQAADGAVTEQQAAEEAEAATDGAATPVSPAVAAPGGG